LKGQQKGKGGDRKSDQRAQPALSDFAQAKEQAKISDDQAKRWQKLADVPQEKFEGWCQAAFALFGREPTVNK
jgi:hypothetical protein